MRIFPSHPKKKSMASVSSSIKKELYKIEIESPSGNVVIADEPLESGGQDLGFSPTELLASALAACTSATLRIYADNKGWDLQEVKLEVDLQRDEKANKTTINRKMELFGDLDQKQRDRLLMVANACPVHKILTNQIEINTEYK